MAISYEQRTHFQLGEPDERTYRRVGDILVNGGHISESQLADALHYQEQFGGRLGWICATLGYINRLDLCRVLSEHFELPYYHDVPYMIANIDNNLAKLLTLEEVTRYQVIPFRIDRDKLEVLTSEPEDPEMLAFLRSRFANQPIQQMVITDLDIMRVSDAVHRDFIVDKSINGLYNRNPDESARNVLSRPQIGILILILMGIVVGLAINAYAILIGFLFLVQALYFASFVYKYIITVWGLKARPKHGSGNIADVKEPRNLPVYTILIAAYKEAKVISTLIKAVKRFDYPEDKLDVILLLEEDDKETLEAARRERPPTSWRILTLPDSQPKTKPKALNYGVQFARGEYLTIYDAEDVPDADQLKKAVAAFRTHSDDYICFQASLNYFNRDENFLTKMFTLEYSYWFDCLLPGLDSLGLPIPLGGTSNHFDLQKLRKIGAWDPFNVTEDADLGIRAAAEGYKVGVIQSTTYEEANSKLRNWLRQRSRWVKGYMQTFLVHNRHPLTAVKRMGLKQWVGYNLLIGGTPALFILNPVMWGLFLYYLFTGAQILDPSSMPAILLYLSAINLIIGNMVIVCLNLIAVLPRKNYRLIPHALLSPIYWLLQSVGAYKALWQLIWRPSYWEKTDHGLSSFIPVM
jgi:cellulose synthase/poly-beta-1,6-N-acetylglucosamine synthase-like glycosyltransferase